jgi:hypothetical protein
MDEIMVRTKLFFAMFILAVGTYFLSSTPAQNQDDMIRASRWRHLALSTTDQSEPETHQKVNELGDNGWELVDVENFFAAGETVKTVYYFKKPG